MAGAVSSHTTRAQSKPPAVTPILSHTHIPTLEFIFSHNITLGFLAVSVIFSKFNNSRKPGYLNACMGETLSKLTDKKSKMTSWPDPVVVPPASSQVSRISSLLLIINISLLLSTRPRSSFSTDLGRLRFVFSA